MELLIISVGAIVGMICTGIGVLIGRKVSVFPMYKIEEGRKSLWEPEPMIAAPKKSKEPTVFLHDASDEEMAIRKQPYLRRVLDAIRGK